MERLFSCETYDKCHFDYNNRFYWTTHFEWKWSTYEVRRNAAHQFGCAVFVLLLVCIILGLDKNKNLWCSRKCTIYIDMLRIEFFTRVRRVKNQSRWSHLGNLSIMLFYLLWNYIVWYCLLVPLFFWWAKNDLTKPTFFFIFFVLIEQSFFQTGLDSELQKAYNFCWKKKLFYDFCSWKIELLQVAICMLCGTGTHDAFERFMCHQRQYYVVTNLDAVVDFVEVWNDILNLKCNFDTVWIRLKFWLLISIWRRLNFLQIHQLLQTTKNNMCNLWIFS